MTQTKIKSHYLVRFYKPGTNEAYVVRREYDTDVVATQTAKGDCPPGWRWEIYRMSAKIIASGNGPNPNEEISHARPHQSTPAR